MNSDTDAGGLGSTENPLRVAIVGSGPSGFYAAEALLKSSLTVHRGPEYRTPATTQWATSPIHSLHLVSTFTGNN